MQVQPSAGALHGAPVPERPGNGSARRTCSVLTHLTPPVKATHTSFHKPKNSTRLRTRLLISRRFEYLALIHSLPYSFEWWWQNAWYRLIGTIEHRGENTQGGHYVACTRGPDGFWREYDDAHVVSRNEGGGVEGSARRNEIAGYPVGAWYDACALPSRRAVAGSDLASRVSSIEELLSRI